MALPADFSKIFGSTATGGLTPIGDVNYAKGWEFVGSNPPTKNDFSYLQNLSDLKSQWLYNNKLQRTDPFGDIKSDGTAAIAKAHENLDLGGAAKCDVGTTDGTVAAGNDGRFGKILGVGQSIQNVTASRSLGITYTNTTGRPIYVSVTCNEQTQPSLVELYISGVLACIYYKASPSDGALSGVVPDGAEYSVKGSGGGVANWVELR